MLFDGESRPILRHARKGWIRDLAPTRAAPILEWDRQTTKSVRATVVSSAQTADGDRGHTTAGRGKNISGLRMDKYHTHHGAPRRATFAYRVGAARAARRVP